VDSNPNEIPENICWEVDKVFEEIRNDLYVNHFGELVQGFSGMIAQRAYMEAIKQVAKKRDMDEKEVRSIYFEFGLQHEKDKPTEQNKH
tara:strand:- start:1481 stop:1747 length:267 start_codon:yes stop_codon:yes gene_type:complete